MNMISLITMTQLVLEKLDSRFHFFYEEGVGKLVLNIDIIDKEIYVSDMLEGKNVEILISEHVKPYMPIGVELIVHRIN